MAKCDTCKHNKGETLKPHGKLQFLLLQPTIWMDISMDLIVGFPKLGNKFIIMVVVDCLSIYGHLCGLQHPFTIYVVAQLFVDNILKLHGMPQSIIFYHDPTFTRSF